MFGKRLRWLIAMLAVLAFVAAACGDDDDATTAGSDDTSDTTDGGDGGDGEDCRGEDGCVMPNQPDVNQDGSVKIAILSPGDTNDNGYYESFIVTAREFAERNDWELIIVDKINPADAQEQARNACRQQPDMVAIAASELKDAIPVAEEDVCAGTVWYVAGGQGVEQTPYFFQTTDKIGEAQFATGVAAGEAMKAIGATKAGFITGPELDFSVSAFKAFTAGIRSVLPEAQTVATYTGDFDDSGLGREAAQAQLDQGVELLYPYLGGATDAVADLGKENGVLSVTPGTDRCAEDKFAISSIFSPGDFFAAALEDFEAGQVELGVTREFRLGVDPVPNVKICDTVDNASEVQAAVDDIIERIAAGDLDVDATIEELGNS
jgi:basic membrane protein A and related proteins